MNKERLIEIVNKFEGMKIGVVGDVVLDKYSYGSAERTNPEREGAPLLKVVREEYRLGGAGNVAANLASLGANVSLYCLIGKDSGGEVIKGLCNREEIKINYALEGESIIKERAIALKTGHYLMRVDRGESDLEAISESSQQLLLSRLKEDDIEAIVLSDYNKRVFRNGYGEKIISFANKREIPCIVDPKPENIISFRNATVIRPNIKEARKIVGEEGDSDAEIVKKLWGLTESRYTVVTCAEKGIICYDGKNCSEVPTRARSVVDVTGAGDTVAAAIILGINGGLNLIETVHLANYAAGIVVEKQGTATLTSEELIERIRED